VPFIEVQTAAGRIRGIEQGDVTTFLGVPYGADTSGSRRFRPPVPVEPWDGVRDATTFGPACPQVVFIEEGDAAAVNWLQHPRGGTALEGGPVSEDCLHVNVWTPTTRSGQLPVLVWLHGGGFTNGSGNEAWFNGDRLAPAENIVVVTVTHRLGVFGFLDLRDDAVGGVAGSANAGMLDIVEALRWVQANIAQFGGDPNCVTIAGHSGGSGKVAALLAMPAAKGLFSRAIMQSGPVRNIPSASETAATRTRVLEAMGNPTPAELEQLTIDELYVGQNGALAGIDGAALLGSDSIPGFAPSLDSVDLPAGPFDDGQDLSTVPLLIGWTTHEMALLLAGTPIFSNAMDEEQAIGLLDHFLPGTGTAAYAAAAAAGPNDRPHLLFVRALGQKGFVTETLAILDAVTRSGGKAWLYNFDQPTEVLDGLLGACHALELAYVFGTIDRSPLTGRMPGREVLSREMSHAWATFARDGAPDVPGGWAAWTPERPTAHRFAIPGDSRPVTTTVAQRSNFSATRTPLGTLLKDPASRAVIDELVPDLPKHPMINLAKAMPLDKVLELSADAVTPETAAELRARIGRITPTAAPPTQNTHRPGWLARRAAAKQS
jgi:para-nitrobenzyl esterase